MSYVKEAVINNNRKVRIYEDKFDICSDNWALFSFYVHCRVNLEDKVDSKENVKLISVTEEPSFEAKWLAQGGIWDKKEYTLTIKDGAVLFYATVYGKGIPETMEFFRGGEKVSGSAFSVAGFLTANCQNLDHERSKFLADFCGDSEGYDFRGTMMPLRSAPPPFVFPFWNDFNDDWVGVGLAAEKGKHNFERLVYKAPKARGMKNGCWFEMPMRGYTEIDGKWQSPYIWIGFESDDIAVIGEYARWQYDNFGFKKHITKHEAPLWWRGPLFCGWGAQCALENRTGLDSHDHAAEVYYNEYIEKLEKANLDPTLIMIDDKWQKEYGSMEVDTEKWPDFKAFVDRQHQKGRRVVLWFKVWDPEGIPEDECIMLEGKKFSVDPTNPKYLKRLENTIYKLLSNDEGCYGCDGFKIDFMDMAPRKKGAIAYEKGVYGLEMLKRLFHNIYLFAKKAKSDALINMSSAHPYFAEDCDQFRVHDFDSTLRNPVNVIKFRAEFVKAVMPDVLIDTAGPQGRTREETLNILTRLSKIGVPDLYDFPEDFTAEDYAALKKAWNDYRATL